MLPNKGNVFPDAGEAHLWAGRPAKARCPHFDGIGPLMFKLVD
jgi:hypothetical protein